MPIGVPLMFRRLNLAWQPIFFKLKKLGLAQFENLLVLGTAVATMGAFYKARRAFFGIHGHLRLRMIVNSAKRKSCCTRADRLW